MHYPPEGFCVELDNSKHVTFTKGRTAKRAKSMVAWWHKLSKKQIRDYQHIGHMDTAGLLEIAKGVLTYGTCRKPELFSVSLTKKLRKVVESLREELDNA